MLPLQMNDTYFHFCLKYKSKVSKFPQELPLCRNDSHVIAYMDNIYFFLIKDQATYFHFVLWF